jgi:MerR family transcriptional regulator, mercuric resistance operon regulatory protein
MSAELTISQAANAAGVNVETIRFYQRRGLLGVPDKPRSGPRRYAPRVHAGGG